MAAAVAVVTPARAQVAPPAEPRLALVIGNGAYKSQKLRNPANDARAVAASLRRLGFTVIERIDAGRRTMEEAVLEFGEKLKAGGIGLFYYAGHGVQARGHNYLVPVDAAITSEASVRVQALEVNLVLDLMADARNRANVVILDSCRNNPFLAAARGAKGLAAIDAARGTLIAYSTAPGAVAADGDGPHSPYTAALVKTFDQPGLKAEDLFKRVRSEVVDATKGAQTPWESSSLTGDLIINLNVTINPPAPAATVPGRDPADVAFWTSIQGSADARDYEDYLKQFPKGTFAGLAKRRLDDLARKQQAADDEDRKRVAAAEAERQRLAAVEAEAQRKAAEEAERKRLAAEQAERQRQAATEERKRKQAEEAERKRKDAEAEKQRLEASEAERKRKESVAKKQSQAALATEHDRQAAETEKVYQAALEANRKRGAEGERLASENLEQKKGHEQSPMVGAVKNFQAEAQEEKRAWATTSESNDPERYAAFLQRYPDGMFATWAMARLAYFGWSSAQVRALVPDKVHAPPRPIAPVPTPAAIAEPPSPAPPSDSNPSREEIAKLVYEQVISKQLSPVKYSGDNPKWVGKSIEYRKESINKALAVCLNWAGSSIDWIRQSGGWLAWNHQSLASARAGALTGCVRKHEMASYGNCKCQIVDENDKNALEIPEEFYKRAPIELERARQRRAEFENRLKEKQSK